MTAAHASRFPRDRVTTAVLFPLVIFFLAFLPTAAAPDDHTVWLVSAAVGAFLTLLYWHPYRVLGLAPLALVAVTAAAIWSAVAGGWGDVAVAVASCGLGLSSGAVASRLDEGGRWEGWRTELRVPALVVLGAVLVVLARLLPPGLAGPFARVGYPVGLGLVTLFAWLRLFRPTFELSAEPVLWVMYKVRGVGPGLVEFPTSGPCLVVANHACWLDPVFLAKVLPRRITPMMTSKFYDAPVLRRMMRAFGVIRVPDATYKQDPAEIREAIAALDRGECVVIFPEGFLRRSEEKPLKRFGRGVWQILRERPTTPVFACWIEGGWGSYCSYYNGKPTKNKKPDLRRPIGLGVSAAAVVDPATLEAHLPTRLFLMNRVAEARKHLGLPELPVYELPQKSDDEREES
jgi:1-acyl-sn-glycerol-3-phosphate acyltransferase